MSVFDGLWSKFSGKSAESGAGNISFAPSGLGFNLVTEAVNGISVEKLYETQPSLRTAVNFRANAIALLGLKTYTRAGNNDRVRNRTSTTALLLGAPNAETTQTELIQALVAEVSLYDVAYLAVASNPDRPSNWELRLIPASWVVKRSGGSLWSYDTLHVRHPGTGLVAGMPMTNILMFHGYKPGDPTTGLSPVESLRATLIEQVSAYANRNKNNKNGVKANSVVSRPKDAPEWSPEARERFIRDLRSQFTGDGEQVGGGLFLDDGMTIAKMGFSADEDKFIEAAQLHWSTVAQTYGLSPIDLGILGDATMSNVAENNRGLYGQRLGLLIAVIEDRLNTELRRIIGETEDVYSEFNMEAVLRGDLAARTAHYQSAGGRPYMTPNEIRGLENLPKLTDASADQLATPLNMLIGGTGGINDANKSAAARKTSAKLLTKAAAPETHTAKAEEVLAAFFGRQSKSVLSALGSKADSDWWDTTRWDKELTDDLTKVTLSTSESVGRAALEANGLDPDDYNADQTVAYLKVVAGQRAKWINEATKTRLDEAIASDDEDFTPASVFDEAKGSRTAEIATSLMTTAASFGATESAKQTGGGTKTWITGGANPRPSHAEMSGETVALEDNFSNGMKWPGDPEGGAEEVAHCECELEITYG